MSSLQTLYGALPNRRLMARPVRRLWCGCCHGVSPRNNMDSFHPTYLFQRLLLRQLPPKPQPPQLRRISVFLYHDTWRHMVPLRSSWTNRGQQQSFGSTSGKNTIRSKDDHSSNTNNENHINSSLKENCTDNNSHLLPNQFLSPPQNVKVKTDENANNNVNANDATTIETPVGRQATTITNTDTINDPYWMERFVPKSYRPYAYLARLDKPIGTMLLFWPCVWSIGLASTPYLTTTTSALNTNLQPLLVDQSISTIMMHQLYIVSLFGIGAIVMRGAGCTVNDLWDRRYDQHVARTKNRPLVNGSVTPQQALQFVVLQSSIGLCVLLSLQPHVIDCVYWGCLSLPLVAIYPTMKRFFSYPQLVLGMTFNWGAILGWVAVHGSSNIDWAIVGPLYGSGITWTLVYDTLYAHQDKKDDAKLQLHSTALSFGPNDDRQRIILHGLAALTWFQWLLVGYTTFDTYGAFIPVYSCGVTLAYSHLIWQIQTAHFDNPDNLALRFRSNNTTGAIVAGAISAALAAQIIL